MRAPTSLERALVTQGSTWATIEAPMAPRRSSPPPPPAAAFRRRGAACEDLSHLVEPAPPPVPSDALVLAAKNGNRRAFAGLVLRYRPRILALALHLTGNAHDAEDITQDVFLRAWQHLPTFEHRSAFFTWIYRIAVNRALQARERRRARPESPLDDPRVDLAIAVDAGGSPARAMELRETYHRLVAAFDALSPLLRTTVALTTLQGMTYPEAAEVLTTTEGTVAWRMHEARNKLRDALSREPSPAVKPAAVKSRARKRVERDDEGLSVALAMALAAVVPV